jgi:hypothetical protein
MLSALFFTTHSKHVYASRPVRLALDGLYGIAPPSTARGALPRLRDEYPSTGVTFPHLSRYL